MTCWIHHRILPEIWMKILQPKVFISFYKIGAFPEGRRFSLLLNYRNAPIVFFRKRNSSYYFIILGIALTEIFFCLCLFCCRGIINVSSLEYPSRTVWRRRLSQAALRFACESIGLAMCLVQSVRQCKEFVTIDFRVCGDYRSFGLTASLIFSICIIYT